MLHPIASIGKTVFQASGGEVMGFLIQENDRLKTVISMDFLPQENRIKFDIYKQAGDDKPLSKEILKDIVSIPNEKGMRPQFSPTTTNLSYLLTQTLPNLTDFLPEETNLKKKLSKIVIQFFEHYEEKGGRKTSFVLKDTYLSEWEVAFDSSDRSLKARIQDYATRLEKALSEKFGNKPAETIYTVLVDGEPIASHKEYQDFVLQKNLESAFEETVESTCSVCGYEGKVTQDTARFQFKFYMTDKVNFASYFNNQNFYKAVALCPECYRNLLVGEKWAMKNLKTRLGGFDVYILPQVMWQGNGQAVSTIFSKMKKLPDEFNEIRNIKILRERERDVLMKVKQSPALQENPFIWNFLFFRQAKAAFKILMLIKDVPPSRILEITKAIHEIDGVKNRLFPDREGLFFDLDQIYWIIPMRKKGADLQEYRKVLQIYYHIFTDLQLDATQLYSLYAQLAHLHHFQTYPLFQIGQQKNPDLALAYDTIKWNLFLLFLKKMRLIKGGSIMEDQALESYFPDGMKEAFQELGYNAAQQGLALLGYVLGAVANAQYREGLENKPVLEKINYQGMTDEKVTRLFNELFEKIRQYKRHIGYAERWWAAGKKLYESGRDLPMSSDERVFYLLSGYALNVLRVSKSETETLES